MGQLFLRTHRSSLLMCNHTPSVQSSTPVHLCMTRLTGLLRVKRAWGTVLVIKLYMCHHPCYKVLMTKHKHVHVLQNSLSDVTP